MSKHDSKLGQSTSSSVASAVSEKPFSGGFFDKSVAEFRKRYMKILLGGTLSLIVAILGVLSIFWGSIWKIPGTVPGWVVDFDGGLIGQTVSQTLTSTEVSRQSKVTWTVVSPSQFASLSDLTGALVEQKAWAAIAIHAGSTDRLQASYASPNASYDGTSAITFYGVEARNENAYGTLIKPSAQAVLDSIAQRFALQGAAQLASNTSSTGLNALLATSPQTVLTPVSYTINNLRPFDNPAATAVTFAGLTYQLILAFFMVMLGSAARREARIENVLTLRSLVTMRLASSFITYLFISLCYALLSVAFQLDFNLHFGQSGFLIFWMSTWATMLAVGLALESLLTLLTEAFIPFFMMLWIIINGSVITFPVEVMPKFFRYGYVMPFYNASQVARAILFGTKNTVGVNMAILLTWIMVSCITLPLFQWYVRRRNIIQELKQDKHPHP